jgi:Putative transcriptional regulator
LKGQLLLAMPSLKDPNFADGVVLLCHHDREGSMGLLINRPQAITVGAVLEDMNLKKAAAIDRPTFEGGPVEPFRGFVLHDGWQIYESTLCVTSEIHLTTSRDILEDIARGEGPEHFMLILGYAGWGAGQLEDEINRNDWLIVPSSNFLVFHCPVEQRWILGAQTVGITKAQLSDQVGHA